MKHLLTAVLWTISSYLVGAVVGGILVYAFSSNRHDRSLEATMTGAFVLGPAAALLGLVIGILIHWTAER